MSRSRGKSLEKKGQFAGPTAASEKLEKELEDTGSPGLRELPLGCWDEQGGLSPEPLGSLRPAPALIRGEALSCLPNKWLLQTNLRAARPWLGCGPLLCTLAAQLDSTPPLSCPLSLVPSDEGVHPAARPLRAVDPAL